jgi:hypothetical protein
MEENNVKIQFDLTPERVKELESLMEVTGIRTRKELFNNALSLLEWAVRETYVGNIIAAIDEKNKRVKELVMPALSHVTKATK